MLVRTVEYVAGQFTDVYVGARGGPAVLLWHGRGANEREVLAPLANAFAQAGLVVVVPDWRPDAPDGGKAHLLASLAWTANHAAGFGADLSRWALVGWSRGGRCALGMLFAEATPLPPPAVTVAIAANTELPDPVWGVSATDAASNRPASSPLALVHGVLDSIVPVGHARRLQQVLQAAGTPAELLELPTDHAGVIGTVYDPSADRCVPCAEGQPLRAVRLITAVLLSHLGQIAAASQRRRLVGHSMPR